MDELLKKIMEITGAGDEAARKVVDEVVAFAREKVPGPFQHFVDQIFETGRIRQGTGYRVRDWVKRNIRLNPGPCLLTVRFLQAVKKVQMQGARQAEKRGVLSRTLSDEDGGQRRR